jgi:hypothetical protein
VVFDSSLQKVAIKELNITLPINEVYSKYILIPTVFGTTKLFKHSDWVATFENALQGCVIPSKRKIKLMDILRACLKSF